MNTVVPVTDQDSDMTPSDTPPDTRSTSFVPSVHRASIVPFQSTCSPVPEGRVEALIWYREQPKTCSKNNILLIPQMDETNQILLILIFLFNLLMIQMIQFSI